jgi:transglycosylase-like protein with SLT domain
MRWTRENAYDDAVRAASAEFGVRVPLIKGVIGRESAFVPTARRVEAQLGDASYGLMQLLYSTAKALGYTGTPEGLLDPATNIHYGTMLLAQNLSRTGGDEASSISAYNGGFRPSLGFGARATRPLRICLAWKATAPRDAKLRVLTRDCAKIQNVAPGEFANQVHVDAVLANVRYFEEQAAQPPQPPTVGGTSVAGFITNAGQVTAALLSAALLGILLWLRRRGGQ